MKNYKKPISALLKTASLVFTKGTDKIIYSGLTNIIGEPMQSFIDDETSNEHYRYLPYNSDAAATYQALQSTGVNLAYMLFSDEKQDEANSFMASLALNLGIATIANFKGFECSISELFKFAVCAAVNTKILTFIDLGLNYLIPDSNSEEDDYNIIL